MKKEKVLALLLTAAMCATSAAPVSAADFSDETAETVAVEATEETPEVEAEDTESDVVSDAEETEPEVIAEEAADDYEEGEVSVEAEDVEAAGEEVQALDFSDEITEEEEEDIAEAGSVPIKGIVDADNGSISGVIPGRNNASYYKIDLSSAGGRLSLKGSSTVYMNYAILDERENEIVRSYNDTNHTLDRSYELTQGTYLIKIYNNTDSTNGSFKIRTYFDTEGKTTFAENSNDTIYKASPISLGQKILGHTAENNKDDYYKIVIPEDGKYTFTCRTRTEGAEYQLFLYDSSLNEVEWTMPYASLSCGWELKKGTYYYLISGKNFGVSFGFYDALVTGHTHTFSSSTVNKATLTSNGSITGKCTDCGETTTSTIYRPSSIRLTTTAYTYNGKAKRPGVVVTDVNGRTIGSSSYTVSYNRDAVSAGRHKVTITFRGNYSGTVTRTYTINPKGTSISKLSKVKRGFKVKVRKQAAKTATGYQVQYCIRSNFRGAKTKTFRGTSFTVNRLKKKRVYYVRVRTYKKSGRRTYYSSWSAPKAVKTR
nr:hypothetical protein [uncultured Blautia sp.]